MANTLEFTPCCYSETSLAKQLETNGSTLPTDIFAYVGENPIAPHQGHLPSIEILQQLGTPRLKRTIATTKKRHFDLWSWPAETKLPSTLEAIHYRTYLRTLPQELFPAFCRAHGLNHWFNHNQFCGCCGAKLTLSDKEASAECVRCGNIIYPRINPVCIGLIIRGQELLLGRSPHFPENMYSALAGFMEVGESAEDCLRREIMEEAGIEITNIRWFGSQPWPSPNSLMLAYIADYAGGELHAQAEEIEALDWFHINNLPGLPHPNSIAYQMIAFVKNNL